MLCLCLGFIFLGRSSRANTRARALSGGKGKLLLGPFRGTPSGWHLNPKKNLKPRRHPINPRLPENVTWKVPSRDCALLLFFRRTTEVSSPPTVQSLQLRAGSEECWHGIGF